MPDPDFSPEAIAEALRQATPGPWQAREGWNLMPPMRYEIAAPDVEEWSVVEAGDNDWGPAGGVNKKADAHLIANAPTWLAQLLAALEAVTTERDADVDQLIEQAGALHGRCAAAEAALEAKDGELERLRTINRELVCSHNDLLVVIARMEDSAAALTPSTPPDLREDAP